MFTHTRMKDRNTTKRKIEDRKLYPKEDTVTHTHTRTSVKECLRDSFYEKSSTT
jgi:hypothetical protein